MTSESEAYDFKDDHDAHAVLIGAAAAVVFYQGGAPLDASITRGGLLGALAGVYMRMWGHGVPATGQPMDHVVRVSEQEGLAHEELLEDQY